MALYGGILFILLLPVFFGVRKRKDGSLKIKGIPLWLMCTGAVMSSLFSGRGSSWKQHQQMEEALLVTEEGSLQKRAKGFAIIWLLFLFGTVFSGLLQRQQMQAVNIEMIERPGFGESKKVGLSVSGMDGISQVDLLVRGKEPQEEEYETVFQEAFQEIKEMIFGEGGEASVITEDLKVPSETSKGIQVVCRSLDPDIISDYGYLTEEGLTEEETDAELLLTFRYGQRERQFVLSLVVAREKPVVSKEEAFIEELEKLAESEDMKAYLELPKEYQGHKLTYTEKKTSPYLILLLFAAMGGALYYISEDNLKKAYQKRNRQLEEGYSEFLLKLITLLDAGMSIRNAWMRITDGYKNYNEEKSYLYEEMLITENRMNTGLSEEDAYIAFGRHCGLPRYVKLGNILSQNLRQGISGLTAVLREELSDSLTERKNRALRAGEEASAKLLFPMILMLGVVIVTLAVPAFMNF